jgi:hypothetical protein
VAKVHLTWLRMRAETRPDSEGKPCSCLPAFLEVLMKEWLKAFWEKHVVDDFPYSDACWDCNETSCQSCPEQKEEFMDLALLNGNPKCTLIESFYGKVFVVRPGAKYHCPNLEKAKELIQKEGWEVNIAIIKGSSILRRLQG